MRNRFFASLIVVVALVFGVTNSASADQWDYIYGEDPTNANNVSGNQDLRVDPLGGVFIVGYFYGMFEGLNSNGSWSKFLQHRNVNGTVDWTIPYESSNDNSIPAAPSKFVVDGNGDVLISGCCSDGAAITVSRSGTLTRSVGTITVGAAGHISSCTAFIPSAAGGFVGLCNKHLLKYDNMMNQLWDVDVTLWIGTNNGPALEETSILKGSGDTLWLASSFNSQNLMVDPTSLPQSLRPAIGLSHFSLSTGGYISSFKHYGIIGPIDKKSVAISDRALWIYTQSSGTGYQSFRISVFDSSDGHLVGNVDPRLGVYGQNYDGNISTAVDWASRNGVPTDTGGMCMANALALARAAWINGGNSNDCWKAIVTNDGRRLALIIDKTLFLFEIGGGLPLIDRLISYQSFAGSISAVDADNLGNIYVVGSTFETRVVQSNELRQPAENIQTQSLSANRAFISRNPMGRISLDVLPRTPLRIKVAGTNGVPATGVGAVSMNVTVTSPDGEGFITVYPCDSKPDASNLNYTLDQTVPNAVIAPVSSTGDVCFYTYAKTHLIADVNGYFPTGSGFVSNTPARVIDTRVGSAQGLRTVSKTKVGNGTELRVQLTNLPGGITPATGVGAVSLNVTVTGSRAPSEGGFVTVYPCGNRPDASNLNFQSGQTVPNAVITPVSSNGEVCFYVYGSADLIADINGYFPGGAGFVATEPVRVADTRSGSAQGLRTVTKQRIGGNTTLQLQLTNLPGGITPSSGIGAVSLNVTAVNTTADKFGGYVTTYPCGSIPDVSSLNFVSNQIVPNAVIAPLSANGTICFFAYGQTDLIVDLNGYFPTGAGFTPMSPVRLFDTR